MKKYLDVRVRIVLISLVFYSFVGNTLALAFGKKKKNGKQELIIAL